MKKIFTLMAIGVLAILIISPIMRYCSNGVETAYKEYKPETLLKKYEYFKDLSASIDKKRADIMLFESTLKATDKKDSEYNQLRSELLGIISIHNSLCADYNSQMAKFNYKFCNKGSMPESNLEPLPREIKPYITEINNK